QVVYVTSEDEGKVYVLDVASEQVLKSFEVGPRPRVAAFLPDGSRAYVSSERGGTVSVVDAQKHEVVATIRLPGDELRRRGIAVAAEGRTIYVTTGRGRRLFAIDTASRQPTGSVDVGDRPWGVALSPDGRTLYTANGPSDDVSIVDVASLKVLKKV